MTDEEMILKIGREVLRLRANVAALKGVLCNYRDSQTFAEIPWPAMVEEIEQSPVFFQTVLERREMLEATIALAKDDSQLIRALHEAVFFPAL